MERKQSRSWGGVESKGYQLTPTDATTLKALSARSNYLSQDRVDLGYGGKELQSFRNAKTKEL